MSITQSTPAKYKQQIEDWQDRIKDSGDSDWPKIYPCLKLSCSGYLDRHTLYVGSYQCNICEQHFPSGDVHYYRFIDE